MEVSEEDDLRTRRSLPVVDADSRASDKSEPPLRRRDGLRVRGGRDNGTANAVHVASR